MVMLSTTKGGSDLLGYVEYNRERSTKEYNRERKITNTPSDMTMLTFLYSFGVLHNGSSCVCMHGTTLIQQQ